MSMKKLLRAGALCALAALAGCAGDSSSTSSSSQPVAPTAPQSIKLTTQSAGLVQQVTPKGVTVQLDDHFQSAVLARRNADGSVSIECHDDQQQAEAFVQGATPAQAEVK
jgi:uncharacterized lipoprotein YmbA